MPADPSPALTRWRLRALLLALVLLAFALGALVPYRIDTDTGFQLRGVQQWVRGEVPSPLHLRLPDPEDLAADRLVWSSWWPPGFPLLYSPLATSGASLAATLRLTSLALFLAGALGWMRLAETTSIAQPARVLFALSLAPYCVTIGGASRLNWAEVLSFAAAPWLLALVLRLPTLASPPALLGLGAALGTSYWLKYSLFLAAIPLAVWVAVGILHRHRSRPQAIGSLSALAIGFAIPVIALVALNLAQARGETGSLSGHRADWVEHDLIQHPETARAAMLTAGLAAAPGLAIFQNHLWITHLAYFSDHLVPPLSRLGQPERLLLKMALAVPVTLALCWGLFRSEARGSAGWRLAAAAGAGFLLLLAAASAAVRYNYLAHEPRLAVALAPLVQLLVLGGWWSALRMDPGWRRVAAAASLVAFVAAPSAFAAVDFATNELRARRPPPRRASETGLYVPEISRHDVPAVREVVLRAIRSPHDLVVVAGPVGWGSSLMMWLELPGRTLPVGTFYAPLGESYFAAANLASGSPLRSSRPLRVILVISDETSASGWGERLRRRFPQATGWQQIPSPDHSHVQIWSSELTVQ